MGLVLDADNDWLLVNSAKGGCVHKQTRQGGHTVVGKVVTT